MGLAKTLVVTILAVNIALTAASASYYSTKNIDEAVDPFCYASCSGTYGNDECLADCIKRRFNGGGACTDVAGRGGGIIVEKLCCCNPGIV